MISFSLRTDHKFWRKKKKRRGVRKKRKRGRRGGESRRWKNNFWSWYRIHIYNSLLAPAVLSCRLVLNQR